MSKHNSEQFAHPEKECDLIMKGGVTSGMVYPYAILELAKTYRFRSIGGTSAGGIAAAFSAAAEYSRTIRNDPDGFTRLKERAEELPDILTGLFQPAPSFRRLMQTLMAVQSASSASQWISAILIQYWVELILYGVAGGLAFNALSFVTHSTSALLVLTPGTYLAACVSAFFGIGWTILRTISLLPKHGFGMCPGIQQEGYENPALMDWLHSAIQYIAFGENSRGKPLCFGDLKHPREDQEIIQLRMITTNLSMRRPHTLPDIGLRTVVYKISEWRKMLPQSVMQYLEPLSRPQGHDGALRAFPDRDELPLLVAVRMSLSFPLLFTAVPAFARDTEDAKVRTLLGAGAKAQLKRVWFTDGGLSSNFPIHMFDAVLPNRPTFALSLDELPDGHDRSGRRVLVPETAATGFGLIIHPVGGVLGFFKSILDASKDWQDNLLATMSGQRERITRVYLSPEEGGLNLSMPADRSWTLMGYGREAGCEIIKKFDFDEHRWRRAIVAFDQLDDAFSSLSVTWTQREYSSWFDDYSLGSEGTPKSYKNLAKKDRQYISRKFTAASKIQLDNPNNINNRDRKLPRPRGRLSIGPRF